MPTVKGEGFAITDFKLGRHVQTSKRENCYFDDALFWITQMTSKYMVKYLRI